MYIEQKMNNYCVRQKNWLKANKIIPYQLMFVLKSHESRTKGWNNGWVETMDTEILTIQHYNREGPGGLCLNNYAYPYTILLPLPLGTTRNDYEIKSFRAFQNNELHYALVRKDVVTEPGEFYVQRYGENNFPCLRKYDVNIDGGFASLFKTYYSKGYVPMKEVSMYDHRNNKVLATTLKGIGLPIMQHPTND